MLNEKFLQPSGLSQTDLAQAIDVSTQLIHELVNEKRGLGMSTAFRLSKYFGNSLEFWVNLQRDWDVYQHMHDPKLQAELDKITPTEAAQQEIESQKNSLRDGSLMMTTTMPIPRENKLSKRASLTDTVLKSSQEQSQKRRKGTKNS